MGNDRDNPLIGDEGRLNEKKRLVVLYGGEKRDVGEIVAGLQRRGGEVMLADKAADVMVLAAGREIDGVVLAVGEKDGVAYGQEMVRAIEAYWPWVGCLKVMVGGKDGVGQQMDRVRLEQMDDVIEVKVDERGDTGVLVSEEELDMLLGPIEVE
ncbi:hypothetical protein [Poriferisphaera corsica]|nr:hypothetical protein [Poriferisphaera corsica]